MATSTTVIPSEFEPVIKDAIASGKYRSEQDVLNTALRMWREREEKLDALRAEIQIGIDQLDRGEWSDGEEAIQRIRDTIASRKGSQR